MPQNLLLLNFVPDTTSNAIVPPGASGSMDIYLTSDVGVSQFEVGISNVPLDDSALAGIVPLWGDLLDAAQLLPPGADPTRFDQMAVDVADTFGETLADALAALAENAKLDFAGETEPGGKADLELRRLSIAAGAGLLSVPAANVFTQFYPTPSPGPAADGVHQDFVIVVAVEDYSNRRNVDGAGTGDLPDTQNDLRHLLDFYQRDLRIGEKQITVLRDLAGRNDDGMTFAKIQQAWKDTVTKADADDKIKFHFTGHGADRGALVLNNPAGREAVTSEMLRNMLVDDRMRGEVLMVFDSCHSGALSVSLDPLPRTRRESACSAAEETFTGENSFTKRWVAAHRNMLNDHNGDGEVTTSEAFDKAAADMAAAHGTHANDGGDPSVEQKLRDDLGDAAREFEQFLAGLADVVLGPFRTFRRILNFFGFDPNEKTGPIGVGAENYVAEAGRLDYTVYFENDPEFANAPAQVVTITDQLSADLDWNTFQFGEVAFGDNNFTLTGTQRLSTASVVDIKSGLIADVRAELDPTTGVATWTFATIDPRTGERTIDPLAGFLPPNVTSPEGEGHVAFSVRPRDGLASGTTIANSASIVFDTNDPIITNEHVVTFDFDPPTSAVDPLPAALGPSFAVSWSGADAGSGIAAFDVFVSVDGGVFELWLDDVSQTEATYHGAAGRTYAFYSVATDNVGHAESAPANGDARTTVTALAADFNGDGRVDLNDLAFLQSNLGRGNNVTAANGDLNGDKFVNGRDVAIFASYYGHGATSTLSSPAAVAQAVILRANAATARREGNALASPQTTLRAIARRASTRRAIAVDAAMMGTDDRVNEGPPGIAIRAKRGRHAV